MNTTLYTCLIEEQSDVNPFVQVYWARASHLGEAIEMMAAAARDNGFCNPIPRECDPYDINNLESDVEPNPEADVFWATIRHSFPPEPTFNFPVGVIASCIEGEQDVDEITQGYTIEIEETGLTSIEVNVDSNNLIDLYSKLLRLHPNYRVFWYIAHGHWVDDSEDRFLVNEEINTPKKILGHLNTNRSNSLENGFVSLTSYLEDGSTNLTITDHKRIFANTYSSSVAEKYTRILDDSGYQRTPKLVSIEKIHHWHYRAPWSTDRVELEAMLKENGFTDWEPGKG